MHCGILVKVWAMNEVEAHNEVHNALENTCGEDGSWDYVDEDSVRVCDTA